MREFKNDSISTKNEENHNGDIKIAKNTVSEMFNSTWFSFRGTDVLILKNTRIDGNLPSGYFKYDIRHGDNPEIPLTIEKNVKVNLYGILISDRDLSDFADSNRSSIIGVLNDWYINLRDNEILDFIVNAN